MEFLALALFIFYLAPWVLAESIEHRRANAILFLNLALGWTGIGWLAAAGWVYRDWPREVSPPNLVVVRPGPVVQPPNWRRAVVPALVSLVLVAGVATVAGLSPSTTEPDWEIGEVDRANARVHMGAGSDWPEIGRLDARCRVRVLEREGGWLRVWRLEDCGEGMTGGAGWVRMEALRSAAKSEP